MGEKARIAIIDFMKSDEMRDFFKEVLQEQTEEIVSAINSVDEKRIQGDIDELRNQVSREKQICSDIKQKNSELILQNKNLQLMLGEKIKEVENLSEQNSELEMKISTLELQNGQLNQLFENEKASTEQCRFTWEEEKRVMSDKLVSFEERFSTINTLYEQYNGLPISVKQRISNIFANDNVYSIIVAVSDWNSIEGLWGFIKRRIIEDEKEGLSELINVFTESFSLYSLIEGTGRYKLIIPNIGDRFDSDIHSIKGIKTDGVIEKVLLTGIYDFVSKKIVFKALVQIQ